MQHPSCTRSGSGSLGCHGLRRIRLRSGRGTGPGLLWPIALPQTVTARGWKEMTELLDGLALRPFESQPTPGPAIKPTGMILLPLSSICRSQQGGSSRPQAPCRAQGGSGSLARQGGREKKLLSKETGQMPCLKNGLVSNTQLCQKEGLSLKHPLHIFLVSQDWILKQPSIKIYSEDMPGREEEGAIGAAPPPFPLVHF